jgi:hypothetical protein
MRYPKFYVDENMINTTADLSKPEISVRFYLGDVGPIGGNEPHGGSHERLLHLWILIR